MRLHGTVFWGAAVVFLCGACHGHRASNVHVRDAGVHVVSGYSAHSVVWSNGTAQRVCSLAVRSGKAHGKRKGHNKRGHRLAQSDGTLDAALFRLCEARGNGDLTSEQYNQALTTLLERYSLDARPFTAPSAHPAWRAKDKHRHHFDGGSSSEGRCPHCRAPDDREPQPEAMPPPPPVQGDIEQGPTSTLLGEMLEKRE